MERDACVLDDIFRIDGFSSTVAFNHFRSICIQGLREFIDHIFIGILGGNQMHRAHIHTRERFRLPFIGVSGDGYRVKERIFFKKRLFCRFVERDEEDILRTCWLAWQLVVLGPRPR